MTEQEFVDEVFALAQTEEIEKLANETIENAKRKAQGVELKEAEIFNVLNVAYIAKRFFGKSRSWLSHKINHNLHNGKPAKFSDSERQQLKEAIKTIASELQDLAEEL